MRIQAPTTESISLIRPRRGPVLTDYETEVADRIADLIPTARESTGGLIYRICTEAGVNYSKIARHLGSRTRTKGS